MHRAGLLPEVARDDVDGCGLAGAVRAHEAEGLPPLELEGDALETELKTLEQREAEFFQHWMTAFVRRDGTRLAAFLILTYFGLENLLK